MVRRRLCFVCVCVHVCISAACMSLCVLVVIQSHINCEVFITISYITSVVIVHYISFFGKIS